jgi:hypothetical protein
VLLEGEGSPTAPREVITGRMGMCPYCSNAWCVECGKSWHGLSSCQNIMAMWREGNKEVREALEKRFVLSQFMSAPHERGITTHPRVDAGSVRRCSLDWSPKSGFQSTRRSAPSAAPRSRRTTAATI